MKAIVRVMAMIVCMGGVAVFCGAGGKAWADGPDDVKAAGRHLIEALDKDQSISQEVKDALKRFVETVEKSTAAGPEVSPQMMKRFEEEMGTFFKEKKEALPKDAVLTKYDHGFGFYTPDNKFNLKINGYVHADYRWFNHANDRASQTDSFFIRRAFLTTSGKLYDHVAFKLEGDLALTSNVLQDAYIESDHLGKEAKVRMGQFKEPFGYEQSVLSSRYLATIERSMATNALTPSYDQGAMIHGNLAKDAVTYQLGLFNDNGANTKDDNSDKAVAGRLAVQPFKSDTGNVLEGLSVGANGTWGKGYLAGSGKTFKTAPGTTWMTFATMRGATQQRAGADAQWFYGPASIQAEWLSQWWNNASAAGSENDIRMDGWYLTGTYLLTGEKKVSTRLKPKNDFDLAKGGWGAWELAARWEGLKADDHLVSHGLATSGSSNGAQAVTAGVNWYINDMTRFSVDYIHSWFDDTVTQSNGTRIHNENSILGRLQIEF